MCRIVGSQVPQFVCLRYLRSSEGGKVAQDRWGEKCIQSTQSWRVVVSGSAPGSHRHRQRASGARRAGRKRKLNRRHLCDVQG